MDLDNVSEDDPLLARLDMILLTVQKDVTRNTVLASTAAMFQGLVLLSIAWLADSFIMTIVIGLVGGIVFILFLLVAFTNFKKYLKLSTNIQKTIENHPAVKAHPTIQEQLTTDDSEDDNSS